MLKRACTFLIPVSSLLRSWPTLGNTIKVWIKSLVNRTARRATDRRQKVQVTFCSIFVIQLVNEIIFFPIILHNSIVLQRLLSPFVTSSACAASTCCGRYDTVSHCSRKSNYRFRQCVHCVLMCRDRPWQWRLLTPRTGSVTFGVARIDRNPFGLSWSCFIIITTHRRKISDWNTKQIEIQDDCFTLTYHHIVSF